MLVVGCWSAWTTYGAAQTWGWMPGWSEVAVAAAGGAGAAMATAAGLIGAGVAGAQSARRALQEHREAQERFRVRVRAEVVETERAELPAGELPAELPAAPARRGPGRHRAPVTGRRGWRERDDQAAIAPAARRALDDATERLALPVGTRGTATAAAQDDRAAGGAE